MAILTLSDFMDMIKPQYNNQAQLFLALTEINGDEQVQLDEITDVYVFRNGIVAAVVPVGCEPEYKIAEVNTKTFNDYTLNPYTMIDMNTIELDVFPHE